MHALIAAVYICLFNHLLIALFDRSLACSDPHPPNLGGEAGGKGKERILNGQMFSEKSGKGGGETVR